MPKELDRCVQKVQVDGEDSSLAKCGNAAYANCWECKLPFCADESEPHLFACRHCGRNYCLADYGGHECEIV